MEARYVDSGVPVIVNPSRDVVHEIDSASSAWALRARAPSRARVSESDRAATGLRESNPNRIGDRSLALWSDGEADWTPGMTVVGRPRGIFLSTSLYRLNWDGPSLARRHANGRNRRAITERRRKASLCDLKHGTG